MDTNANGNQICWQCLDIISESCAVECSKCGFDHCQKCSLPSCHFCPRETNESVKIYYECLQCKNNFCSKCNRLNMKRCMVCQSNGDVYFHISYDYQMCANCDFQS